MKNRTVLISSFMIATSILYALNISAETQAEKGKYHTETGSIKEVNCKTGEVKVSGKNGEELFNLTDKTEFRNIKGCDDIKKDGRALIQYSDVEGRKVVKAIKYTQSKSKAGDRGVSADRKQDLFMMGWVGSVDCGKGMITLQQMTDKSKTESFRFEKDTMFTSGIKGCGDISANSIVAIRYVEKDKEKVVMMIKPMIEPERK